jgi:hypothetical protein
LLEGLLEVPSREGGATALRAELTGVEGRELHAIAPAPPPLAVGDYCFARYPLGFCYAPTPGQPTLILYQPERRHQADRLALALPQARRLALTAESLPDLEPGADEPLVLACAATAERARAWYEALLRSGFAFAEFRSDEAIWHRWRVQRQDDNGNRFNIEAGLSEQQARQLAANFEQRGHKQLYWAEPMLPG